MQIDKYDRQIMTLLQDNARRPVADMARTLGLARSTVQARLDRLEETGAIAGYALKVGRRARAQLNATALVCVEPRTATEVISQLKMLHNVEKVHTTSGRWDLMVHLAADTPEEVETTLDRIGGAFGVSSVDSLVHLATKLDKSSAH